MFYPNFDEMITAKYGVIYVNWPLQKFCSPSDVGSRNELQVLYRAFESGTTYFRLMDPDEFKRWEGARYQVSSPENQNAASSSGDPTNSCLPPPTHASTTPPTHDSATPPPPQLIPPQGPSQHMPLENPTSIVPSEPIPIDPVLLALSSPGQHQSGPVQLASTPPALMPAAVPPPVSMVQEHPSSTFSQVQYSPPPVLDSVVSSPVTQHSIPAVKQVRGRKRQSNNPPFTNFIHTTTTSDGIKSSKKTRKTRSKRVVNGEENTPPART